MAWGQVRNRFDVKPWEHYIFGMTKIPENAAPGKILSPAAKRALKEAAERREVEAASAERPPETAGPKGVEPTRFGDWERGGIAYDF